MCVRLCVSMRERARLHASVRRRQSIMKPEFDRMHVNERGERGREIVMSAIYLLVL